MIDSLKPAGTETQLLALIQHLDRSQVQPALCLLDGEDETSRALEPKDCPVLRLGVRGLSRPQTLAKAWQLARFLRHHRIDILQVYFLDSTYLGVVVGRLARVPWIIRTRNNIGYWTTPGHQRLGRLCNWLADGLVANCQACAQAVTDDECLSPKRIIVLENGVDLSRFPDRFASRPISVGRTSNPSYGMLFSSEAKQYGGERNPGDSIEQLLPYECLVFGPTTWEKLA